MEVDMPILKIRYLEVVVTQYTYTRYIIYKNTYKKYYGTYRDRLVYILRFCNMFK